MKLTEIWFQRVLLELKYVTSPKGRCTEDRRSRRFNTKDCGSWRRQTLSQGKDEVKLKIKKIPAVGIEHNLHHSQYNHSIHSTTATAPPNRCIICCIYNPSLFGAETLLCCLGDVLQVPLLWTFIINSFVFFFFLFSFLLSFVFPYSMVVLVNFCTCYLLFLYYAILCKLRL